MTVSSPHLSVIMQNYDNYSKCEFAVYIEWNAEFPFEVNERGRMVTSDKTWNYKVIDFKVAPAASSLCTSVNWALWDLFIQAAVNTYFLPRAQHCSGSIGSLKVLLCLLECSFSLTPAAPRAALTDTEVGQAAVMVQLQLLHQQKTSPRPRLLLSMQRTVPLLLLHFSRISSRSLSRDADSGFSAENSFRNFNLHDRIWCENVVSVALNSL